MADLRRESEHIAASCNSFKPSALGNCAYTLVTSYPVHLSLGSLAPGNGFAFGAALSERYTPNENWRITFSGDAVRSPRGSNRLGGYAKFTHSPAEVGVVVTRPGDPPVRPRRLKLDTWVVDVFAQRTLLEAINYFGQGPDTVESGRTSFAQRQVMFGSSAVLPMSGASWFGALRPALLGGITRRSVAILPGIGTDGPPLQDHHDDASAPGLARQNPFLELREGVRFRPSLPNDRLQFDYRFTAQQFIASAESGSSFRRFTIDLHHRIPIYRGSVSTGPPRDFNGPNECSATLKSLECPAVTRSRDRSGALGLRVLWSRSSTRDANRVPFYFQPTLGGSDLNGETILAGYNDYRFRGPHLLAMQESFEHSLWDPVGVFVMVEQGRTAQQYGDLGFSGLKHSISVGLTLRAGGLPAISFSVAWGSEGHHVIGAMNDSLLGGSARSSLY
jgi:hypothetical protein